MVEKYNLRVLFTFDLLTRAHSVLFCHVQEGIDVDDLSVSPVPEEEALVRIGIHLEVRGVIVLDLLALPRVKA